MPRRRRYGSTPQSARGSLARDDYGPTEVYRFYDGPIDNAEDGPEGLVNAWPLDEAYIDYVEGDPDAGIVNNPGDFPAIDADLIVSLNEEGGEENVSTGWHAIEFLLWGQDLNDDSPGLRPVEDYTTNANADRRSTYLATVSDVLVRHLREMMDAWAPGDSGNYRAEFLSVESGRGAQAHRHRHRRDEQGRTRRRADGGRLRDAFAGGRALLLRG